MSEASYFVGIDQPADVRRNLLETAKLSVSILKGQYRLRALRARKLEAISELTKTVDELQGLLEQVQVSLPEHKADTMPEVAQKIEKKHAAAKEAASKKTTVPKAKVKKPMPKVEPAPVPKKLSEHEELALLEQKLAAIEKKLNKL